MTTGRLGRQSDLHKGAYEAVIAAVPQVMIQTFVAGLARVSESALSEWLIRGRKDLNEGIDSIYAQLAEDYHEARCKVIREKIDLIAYNPDLRAGNQWILERCFREQFGKDSAELQELRALFNQLVIGGLNGQQGKRDPGTTTVQTEGAGQP